MTIDLNELEFDNIANWPLAARIVIILFISGIIFFLGYWFDIKNQLQTLEVTEEEELLLRNSFEEKHNQAENLPAYKQQIIAMKAAFNTLLRQLPESAEVPGLLEDISHQGLAAGLEFQSIRLLSEVTRGFYVELPIEISVLGTYNQFANFASNVAALPRIVTLHDFIIHLTDENSYNGNALTMKVMAKTYRYTEEKGL